MPQRDVERAETSGSATMELDALYDASFRELLTYMMEDPRNISLLRASAVLRQEHRADRRSRHQYRRDRRLLVTGANLRRTGPRDPVSHRAAPAMK